MKRLLIIAFVAITGFVYAQKSETRNVDSFNGVKAQAGVDVYLKKGTKESLKVEVEGNIKPSDVKTEVSGGILKISVSNGNFNNVDMKVYVTYVELDKLMTSAAASIFCENVIKTSKLTLYASSSGAIEVQVDVDQLEANASSAGEIDLKGKADESIIDASTAGEVDAYELTVNTVKAKASTGGSAKVNAVKEIEAKASTGGDVRYRGNPERSNTSSSTGGSVKKSN